MGDKFTDFKVQFQHHELHPVKSADLAEMIRIGLSAMQSDPLAKTRITLSKGAVKIVTAGRGFDKWLAPGSEQTKQTEDEGSEGEKE